MRIIFLLIISLTISGYIAIAQKGKESKWTISYSPEIITPKFKYGVQPGVEYKINQRFTLLTELTFLVGQDKDSSFSNMQYVRIKPELRWSFLQRSRWLGNYVGLQLSYSFRNWRDLSGGSYFQSPNDYDTAISYDRARINSPVFTASIQSGRIFSVSKKISFDLFYGMGVRVIHTVYSELVNQNAKKYYSGTICKMIPLPDPAFRFAGNISRFQLNAGLRILYHFD